MLALFPKFFSAGIYMFRHFFSSAVTTALLLSSLIFSGCASSSPALDEKIGQMLMVGFRGAEIDENHFIAKDIQERNLGGVILFDYDVESAAFDRNIKSPKQVAKLTETLKSFADKKLLVAVDQEGGIIARLKTGYGFPATSSHMYLGKTNDLLLTYSETYKLASTLKENGFNMNMTPVADLCINPDNPVIAVKERCFSNDPHTASLHAVKYIEAHHKKGLITTLKHFPGHGSSKADSHLGLTDITNTWSEKELEPYREIISSGQTDVVMTAHVFNGNIDTEYPATLSEKAINGILRDQLGFEGVVISDDMQMGAIVNYYGFETAIEKAVKAGVDILVFGNNMQYDEQVVPKVISIIKELVNSGSITESRIDESYRRIVRLKEKIKN